MGTLDMSVVELYYKTEWKKRVEYSLTTDQKASFYIMERKAEVYARSFYYYLAESGEVTDENKKVIPLTFLPLNEIMEEYSGKERVKYSDIEHGRFIRTCPPQRHCIQIALPIRNKNTALPQSLKRVIRHELIHYYLFVHSLPHEDNSALFHAYCDIYDAEAYMPLNEDEEKKLNLFHDLLKDERDKYDIPCHLQALLAQAAILRQNDTISNYCQQKEAYIKNLKNIDSRFRI